MHAVRAARRLRALIAVACLLSTSGCDFSSGTGGQRWARVESTGFVLLPGEISPAGLVVAKPDIGFAGGLKRQPTHTGTATWEISDTTIVSASQPIGTIRAQRLGRVILRGRVSGMSDTATATVVADSGAVRLNALSVRTGNGFACAERVDQRILCWGSSWYGQLGNGVRRTFTATLSPVPIASPEPLHALTLGWGHACGIDASGRAWCWGINLARQIRDAEVADFPRPVLVANGKVFSSIAPGGRHTCGLSNGVMLCWGGRFSATDTLRAPRPLMALRSGTEHLCALDDSQHVWCQGDNRFGQLGVSTTAFSRDLLAVDTAHTYFDVVPGSFHTCGLTTQQTVRCWGYGELGELGTGDRVSSPVPVDVSLPAPVMQISTGVQTSCALLVTQRLYCWGYNLRGSIGAGPPPPNPSSDELVFASPVAVASPVRFKQIAAGRGSSACAISITDVVYCWGTNLEGSVGAGRHDSVQLWQEMSFFWTPTLVRSVVP